MSRNPPDTTVHRALSDARRVRIVQELEGEPDGLDANELGRRVGLHPNTIRWHLGVLADAGIVDSRPGERTRPGRPRILFTIRRGEAEQENYRLLASILTGGFAQLPDTGQRAEEAGQAWGRYLVDPPPPHVQMTDDAAIRQITDLLDEHGFRPEADAHEIRMHRCPFRELAETAPGVVCAVHRGLISGALTGLRSRVVVDQLDPFVQPELCVVKLRVGQGSEEEPAS